MKKLELDSKELPEIPTESGLGGNEYSEPHNVGGSGGEKDILILHASSITDISPDYPLSNGGGGEILILYASPIIDD